LLKRVPYKTSSIFFRNIPVSTKIEDLENECKNYPGFLRIGLSEPLNDQNFVRRLWVTFRRPDVNIREIFWNIKDAKVRHTLISTYIYCFSLLKAMLSHRLIVSCVAVFEPFQESHIIVQSFKMTFVKQLV
jgi:hypothetical protein